MNNWDEIWIKKGNEQTNDLNILNGFDVCNLKFTAKDTVESIIKQCKILKTYKILEVGSGAGRLAKVFLEKQYDYYAVEKSESLVNKFKKLIDKNKIQLNNTNLLPFESNTFDIVFCWSIIQYLDSIESFKILLNEMSRVAKKYIFLGDIYEFEEYHKKNYKYQSNTLKHLFIPKQYFTNNKSINVTSKMYKYYICNFNNSTNTRYNCLIYLNKTLKNIQKVQNFFNADEIDDINDELLRLEKKKDIKNYIWKYYEFSNKSLLSRIEYFVKHSTKFKKISEFFFNNRPYYLMKDKINCKYPNGEGFAPHQDAASGWLKYSNHHITVAIPLTDTTIQNGCLWVADINCDKLLTKEFTDLTADIVDDMLYKPIETKKGDIIIFDSFVPHKSFINKTKKSRKILFFTYSYNENKINTMYEDYHRDKFLVVPPDIYRLKNKKYRSGNTFKKR